LPAAILLVLGSIAAAGLGVILVLVGFLSGRKKAVGKSASIGAYARHLSLVPAMVAGAVLVPLFADWFRDVLRARAEAQEYSQKQAEKARYYNQFLGDPNFVSRVAKEFRISYEAIGPGDYGETRITLDGRGALRVILVQNGVEKSLADTRIPLERIVDLMDLLKSPENEAALALTERPGQCQAIGTIRALSISNNGRTACVTWDQTADLTPSRPLHSVVDRFVHLYFDAGPKVADAMWFPLPNGLYFHEVKPN
jgi:hypothetical protein